MKKYILPFILLSIVGLFIFALTNKQAKFVTGDCVIQAGARIKEGESSFIHIIAVDRLQYRIIEYFQKDGKWKASEPKFFTKAHLDQTSYKDKCDQEIISSLGPKL